LPFPLPHEENRNKTVEQTVNTAKSAGHLEYDFLFFISQIHIISRKSIYYFQ
jgi:hypothetical protein